MSDVVRTLVDGVLAHDRRALARAITLVESTKPEHQDEATALVEQLLPATGDAVRVGISGAPGVGKSTFIEVLGMHLIRERGHRVAVLAVDPSSAASGGSILGDKTRMSELARDPAAFIRPSPSRGTLGGVASRTREAVLLCEAFGFDVVLVETVGVGQSETVVAELVDTFALLVQPGGGDDLQGIKRGIIELADIVAVTKADGELTRAAAQATADYTHAAQFLRRKHAEWKPPVLAVSAATNAGVDEFWGAVETHRQALLDAGSFDRLRSDQARAWLWSELHERLLADFKSDPRVVTQLADLEREVAAGTLSPRAAADRLVGERVSPGG